MQALSAIATRIEGRPGVDLPAGWVAGDQLGKPKEHVERLYRKLRQSGRAKRIGRACFFDPHTPTVARLLAVAGEDRSYADLSGFSARQIEDARRKVRILERSRIEIAHKLATSRMQRTTAVEWYCKVRCEQLGFGSISVGTFSRWGRRYRRGGPNKLLALVDTRGRKTGAVVSCSPEAWSYFCGWYLDGRKRSVQLCYELTAERAEQRGWAWPGRRTILRKISDIPQAARVLAREGEHAFKSKCLPRIRRSYEHVAAGDVFCCDECTLDLYARAPDGRGGWKRVRPILTAILDVRSRMFVGWHIGARANSDTIVAAFKMAVQQFGPPLDVVCDNGEDYKSVGGRRKKWVEFDQKRLANVYAQLGCTVRWATPYAPWAKMIESHFRAIHERCDKLFDTYCGNKPENRPEGVEHIPVWQLPTVDEVRERFGEWLPAHHARPQTGDGMFSLSPDQAMQQFRSKTPRQRLSGDFLDYLCAKVVGPVKVTRDGVRHQGIHYGQGCEELLRRQGQQVLLRVHPDRADYVDVTDLQGRPITRAANSRLTGVSQDDIREGQSRRKRARRLAREARGEAVYALKHNNVSAAIAAQRNRNRSTQQDVPAPDPPAAIKAVRPDLREGVERIAAEHRADGARTAAKRRVAAVDFAAINRALLGIRPSEGEPIPARSERRIPRRNVDAILASGRLDDGPVEDTDIDGDDGSAPLDAFEAIGKTIHEHRKRA